MSWVEIHCEYFGKPCPYNPTPATCNKDCQHYEPDRRAFGSFYCDKEKTEIQGLKAQVKELETENDKLREAATRYIVTGRSGEWIKVKIKYNYIKGNTKNNTICPICDGLGMPWRGWFSCEDCDTIALIETGDVFVKQVLEDS